MNPCTTPDPDKYGDGQDRASWTPLFWVIVVIALGCVLYYASLIFR